LEEYSKVLEELLEGFEDEVEEPPLKRCRINMDQEIKSVRRKKGQPGTRLKENYTRLSEGWFSR
jgi:hypothetical protein